jgi:hypothetical protein
VPTSWKTATCCDPAADRSIGGVGPGAGGRIQEFTWEGELVWDYAFQDRTLHPHHDICRLPNGHVLAIASETKSRDEALAAGRLSDSVESQLLPECIVEIKPTGPTSGEIVWQWRAWDHLVQDDDDSKPNYGDASTHPERIDINFGAGRMDALMQDPEQRRQLQSLGYVGGGDDGRRDGGRRPPGGGPGHGDWMHVNFVDYNPALDQIMLSVHEFSEVWVIDHSTTTAEAASSTGGRSGKGGDLLYRWGNPQAYRSGAPEDQRLFAQHCAHWIPPGVPGAGNLLLFNNGAGREGGAYSSVDEIVLPLNDAGLYDREQYEAFDPREAVWSFAARKKSGFFSALISSVQRLPNGNTFICSGNQAMLFEVTPTGNVVWQYRHPGGEHGGPGGPPRPGELVPHVVQDRLALTEDQRRALEKLQAEVGTQMTDLLTDQQRQRLEQPMGGPAGGGRRRGPRRGPAPWGPGPGGRPRPGGFGPLRIGTVLPTFLIEALALTDAQQTELQQMQEHVDQELERIWTAQQAAQLKEMEDALPRGPGRGPPPGFGPPGRPPGPRGPGRLGGPGGPGRPGGPDGIFCSFRYAEDYPGLAGRVLRPGEKLADVAARTQPSVDRPVGRGQ